VESFYDREGKFVKALTPAQENRLMQVLLGLKSLESNGFLLIETLQDFDDPRFVPFLLAQMRQTDEMWQAQSLMLTVAHNLHDPALKVEVDKFLEEVNSDEDEDEADEVEASASSSAYKPSDEDEDEDDQQVPDVSTGELKRKARIAYFIALAEGVVAPKPNDPPPHSQPTP
ncbi:MAG: hypothetical protein JOZ52_12080, partial [Acidobacteria bacterium]|nr:hypothetical protein [Acidobacteriota bacterium]